MRKKLCSLLLALVFLFSLAACGAAPAVTDPSATPSAAAPEQTPTPTPEPTPEPASADSAAMTFAKTLVAGDYEACSAMFSALVAEDATPEIIEGTWKPRADALGGFVGIDSARTIKGEYGYLQYEEIFCEYEKGGLVAVTLFAGDEELIGLSVLDYLPESALQFDGVTEHKPLLWHVTSPEGAEMYLFGSIHAADSSLYDLPKAVTEAYDSCDTLALELDIVTSQLDFGASLEMQQSITYSDGGSLREALTPETYELVVNFLSERGLWDASYDIFTPYALHSLVNQCVMEDAGLSSAIGVDMLLGSRAIYDGKETVELEGMEFQMNGLLSMPDIYWDAALRSAIKNYDEGVSDLLELYAAYCSGDEEKAAELAISDEEVDPNDPALDGYSAEEREAIIEAAEALDKWMLAERNGGMAEKALAYLKEGRRVFLVVGAAHMLGDGGLPALLENAGCTVERVIY